MIFLIPLSILLLAYCLLEFRAQSNPRFWTAAALLKVAVSLSIALLAWSFSFQKPGGPSPALLALGLSFAVPADYFLQFIDRDAKRYSAGIVFFSLMHLSLLTGFFWEYKVHMAEFVLFAFILICIFDVQKFQKWKITNQKVLLSFYTALVTLMAAKSLSVGMLNQGPDMLLTGLGGAFFLASDIILGIWEYTSKRPSLAVANRAVYFMGQIFFAYSLFL